MSPSIDNMASTIETLISQGINTEDDIYLNLLEINPNLKLSSLRKSLGKMLSSGRLAKQAGGIYSAVTKEHYQPIPVSKAPSGLDSVIAKGSVPKIYEDDSFEVITIRKDVYVSVRNVTFRPNDTSPEVTVTRALGKNRLIVEADTGQDDPSNHRYQSYYPAGYYIYVYVVKNGNKEKIEHHSKMHGWWVVWE